MLDKLILEKSDQISYYREEINNIASTLDYLKNIINNVTDFEAPFLGGSYRRGTMVKGISDVDVYFKYIGNGNSQTALVILKKCLIRTYPNSFIKQDKPSILANFNRIPINITPYKENMQGSISIPDKYLINWNLVNFGELERNIKSLRDKNRQYIELIKILKLWNRNYAMGIKNFEIEQKVCRLFKDSSSESISDWIWTFFNNENYRKDANSFFNLMKNSYSDSVLRAEWLRFINNK